MNYPKYVSRKGSKCYFEYDLDTFDKDITSCLQLVAFNTLYLFGHNETSNDDILVLTHTDFKKRSLQSCFELIMKNKLNHRVFHMPDRQSRALFAKSYEGKAFVTDSLVNKDDIPLLHAKRKCKDIFACMKDTYNVNIYTGGHIISADSDSDSEPNEGDINDGYKLGKRVSKWGTSTEPCFDEEITCNICKCKPLIDDTNFTIIEKDCELEDKSDYFALNVKDSYDDGEYDEIFDTKRKDDIILNNLIFDFKNYKFNIKIKKSSAKITFDEKAVGGYRHAAVYTGAVYEVHHAVPSTLKYKNTSYVNKIHVEWKKFKIDNKYIICTEYKAIDVL